MPTGTCPKCQAEIPEGMETCVICQTEPQPQPLTQCSQCGAELPVGIEICLICHPQEQPEPTQTQEQPELNQTQESNATLAHCPKCQAEIPEGVEECPTCQQAAAQPQPPTHCSHCGREILPDIGECLYCRLEDLSISTNRCAKCFNEVPVGVECPFCLEAEKTKELKKEAKARKQKKGKKEPLTLKSFMQRFRTQPVKLAKWQIAVLIVVMMLIGGGAGFWYFDYSSRNLQPEDPQAQAITLVIQTKNSRGNTLDVEMAGIIADLSAKDQFESSTGWNVKSEGSQYRVSYTYKAKGAPPQTANWVVNIAEKTVKPDNDLAKKVSE